MKTIFLIFLALLSHLTLSQKITVYVYHESERICNKATTIDTVLLFPDSISDYVDDAKYVFDIDNLIVTLTREDVNFRTVVDKVTCDFISENKWRFNYYLFGEILYGWSVDLTPNSESILFYSFLEDETTVRKFLSFRVEKN